MKNVSQLKTLIWRCHTSLLFFWSHLPMFLGRLSLQRPGKMLQSSLAPIVIPDWNGLWRTQALLGPLVPCNIKSSYQAVTPNDVNSNSAGVFLFPCVGGGVCLSRGGACLPLTMRPGASKSDVSYTSCTIEKWLWLGPHVPFTGPTFLDGIGVSH